jgi:arsenite-transporting ATPase
VTDGRSRTRPAIEKLLERLPRLALIVGKGGVGKTTCAIGIAAHLAAASEATVLISTDPAAPLAYVLGVTLAKGEARTIDPGSSLSAMQLDPAAARSAFLDRWRDTLVSIIDRGTYLDVEDISGLVDASFPGADEIFGLLVLAQLLTESDSAAASSPYGRFVVDTAPTGHTLRLLALPDTFAAMISLLDSMQAKYRFMVSALTHRYRRDAADDFIDEMRQTIGQFRTTLGDATRAGAVLVTRVEPVVITETLRYAEALRRLGITVAAVIVDEFQPQGGDETSTLEELGKLVSGPGLFALPRIDPPPVGLAASRKALGRLVVVGSRGKRTGVVRRAANGLRRQQPASSDLESGGAPQRAAKRDVLNFLRTLTIVGGKGGVGKTTVSCALAITAALEHGHASKTLLVSTDPAPSIGDALGITTPRWAQSEPQSLSEVPNLDVWQMDAESAFLDLRDRYRDRIDALFDSIMGGSVDIVHDRAIVRDLLALAPPGVDELYALASLGDALDAGRYARIIVDPAPTGHLLRLLEMPTLAVEWSHRLMRLIMKYKDVAGLGEAAQDLVSFSRRTRALDALLHDRTRAGVILVSLDEPVVVAETDRLAQSLASTGIAIVGAIRNRVRDAPSVDDGLGAAAPTRSFVLAPELHPPPVGVATIRDWCERWQQRD